MCSNFFKVLLQVTCLKMPEEPEVNLGQVFVFLKVQSADVMHKLFRDLLIFHSSVVLLGIFLMESIQHKNSSG